MRGDGNCFFRALCTCLGYHEDNYMVAKEILHDYLLENMSHYEGLSVNLPGLAANILKNHWAATYSCLRLAADCF